MTMPYLNQGLARVPYFNQVCYATLGHDRP